MHERAPATEDGARDAQPQARAAGPATLLAAPAMGLVVPAGVPNRALARAAAARRLSRLVSRPTGPAHGTNPQAAFANVALGARPTTVDGAKKVANAWLDGVRKVLQGATAASTGAKYADAIAAGDIKEL